MKLQIGENLKRLRREKDITQEELAEIFGVSYQSVSRWENNFCYPDMELLPSIAQFFGITVDKLLGVNEEAEKEKVNEYLLRFQKAISRGNTEECISVAREGVAEYPNNFALLNKLMYALFIAGDEDGNIPEWKENMKKYDAEITSLGERIIKYCPDQNIRLEATARLAFNHCEMGRKEQGRAVYETLPSQEFCKENHIWWALDEKEKLPFTREQIHQGYISLSAGLYNLTWGKLLPDKDLITVYEKMFSIDKLIYDDYYMDSDFYSAQCICGMARVYARLNQSKEALEQLRIAAERAIAFDNRPESGTIHCLLLGDKEWKSTDFETDDTRTCREIMRDKWLASKDFDNLRDTEEFKLIIKMLK